MAFLRALRGIHVWIGLAAALYAILIAVTGTALLLREPLYRSLRPELAAPFTPPDAAAEARAIAAIEQRLGAAGIRSIRLPRRDFNAYSIHLKDGPPVLLSAGSLAPISPPPSLIRVYDTLERLHIDLLGGRTGHSINGYAGLVMAAVTVAGLALYWLGPRVAYRRSPWPKKRLSPRGLWKLHNTAGAWGGVFILLFPLTGAALIFYQTLYAALSNGAPLPPRATDFRTEAAAPIRDWDQILTAARQALPGMTLTLIQPQRESGAALSFRFRAPGELHPNGRSSVILSGTSLAVLNVHDATREPARIRLLNAAYPLHSGKIPEPYWPGLYWSAALIAGLALTGLGVTGILSFIGRRRRKS